MAGTGLVGSGDWLCDGWRQPYVDFPDSMMIARSTRMTSSATMDQHVVDGPTAASSYVGGIVDYAVERGVARQWLLDAAGLTDQDFDDPYRRLSIAAMIAALRQSAAALNAPDFALQYGRDVECTQISMSATMGQSARTTGEALLLIGRYAPLGLHFPAMEDAPRYHTARDARGALIIDARPADAWPEITEAAFARMARGIGRVGGPQALRAVQLRHGAPPYREAYESIFGVPVHFNADHDALIVDPHVLDLPLTPAPRVLTSALTLVADDQLATLARMRSVRGRVEQLLRRELPNGDVRVHRVARALAMSRQTLYRRLREGGTTFAAVLESVRHARAVELLSQSELSVGEVAALVGFSESAAFSRAFKRWTGQAPAMARRRTAEAVSQDFNST
jgi:AraC-like DNA-binding protein